MSIVGEWIYMFSAGCLAAAPVLFIYSMVVLFQLGRAISAVNPPLWAEMKPGFYTDIRVSQVHDRRLSEFLGSEEYLALKDAEVTRLAVRYRRTRKALLLAMAVAALNILYTMRGCWAA